MQQLFEVQRLPIPALMPATPMEPYHLPYPMLPVCLIGAGKQPPKTMVKTSWSPYYNGKWKHRDGYISSYGPSYTSKYPPSFCSNSNTSIVVGHTPIIVTYMMMHLPSLIPNERIIMCFGSAKNWQKPVASNHTLSCYYW